MAAFSTDAVSNYLIDKSKTFGTSLSPMKLQKLIYFSHGWHLSLSKHATPLVSEEPQAWEYGPVFPSVYHEFKDLGSRAIDRPAYAMESATRGVTMFIPTIIDEAKRLPLDIIFAQAVLDRILLVYGKHSAASLSELTHERGSPWWTVREEAKRRFGGQIPMGLNIPNLLIRDWFKQRFQNPAASTT